ncbi:hydrogenase 4 subunit D [Pyrococcus kukulkanii]|uniref:hydrogenase 4 subunit D n=1 Tax=Pyrococcus kukulkanii TaxID=1609559 RepID=UPI003566C928
MDLIIFSFLVPILAGIFAFRLDGKRADALLVGASGFSLIVITYSLITFTPRHVVLAEVYDFGEVYGLIVDDISLPIAFVVSLVGFLFMLYSIDYLSPHNREKPVREGKGRFHGWMLIFLGSTLGFLFSSSILQMLVFFELMSLACWGVVGFYGTKEAIRAAYKALLMPNFGALVGLYSAFALAYLKTHNLSLLSLSSLPQDVKLLVFLGAMIAAFTKSAQFPLYSWLPDAMEAPTPASAFLHGTAMIEMGVFLLARIVQFMSPIPKASGFIMLFLLAITLLITTIAYPMQKDAKRLLAYSTMAEAAVMYSGVLFAIFGSEVGIKLAMFQIFTHAFVKGLGFLTAGTFSYSLGTLNMGKIKVGGLIGAIWMLSLFGLAGAPPFGIFFSKALLLRSGVQIGGICWAIVLLILLDSTVFFVVSALRVRDMLGGEDLKVTGLMRGVIVILAVLAVIAPALGYKLIVGW